MLQLIFFFDILLENLLKIQIPDFFIRRNSCLVYKLLYICNLKIFN